MIRIIKLTGTYYAREIDIEDENDLEDIRIFISEGTPVILVENISDVSDLDIDPDDIEKVV